MAHFLIAQLNEGRYGNASVLSPEGVAAMHQPGVPTGTPGEAYGMGWEVGEVDGEPAIYHSGDNANYSAHVILLPEENRGVVLLLNANGVSINSGASQIARGVLSGAGRQAASGICLAGGKFCRANRLVAGARGAFRVMDRLDGIPFLPPPEARRS